MDATVLDIIRSHIGYHGQLGSPTREQQLQREASVVGEYRGRVLVELFQNAIDRAEHAVLIKLEPRRLVVANDNFARPLEILPLDHAEVDGGRLRRSDFHALCSMDTSGKRAFEAIGNKGIGFKSVFREADRVEVWSRREGAWWGFRLAHPFTAGDAKRIAADVGMWDGWRPQWEEIAARLEGIAAPSFYFPEPLMPAARPAEAQDPFVTVVVLGLKPGHTLGHQEATFRRMPLHFVSARFPEKTGVAVDVGGSMRTIAFDGGWTPWPPSPLGRPDLVGAAAEERLAFTAERPPAVQLAIPGPEIEDHEPRFHCFFPTNARCGFGLDIHADFLVDPSRKYLEFGGETGGDGYNAKLLDSAADLLIEAVERRLHGRSDVWRFLTPADGAHPELVRRIRDRLFGANWDRPARWLAVCGLAFSRVAEHGAPWSFYQGFWQCFAPWWRVYKDRSSKTWKTFRESILVPLMSAGLPLVPVVDDDRGAKRRCRGVPCPSPGERIVLLRAPTSRAASLVRRPPMPDALLERVAITAHFPVKDLTGWAGIQPFSWAAVVLAARAWLVPSTSGAPRWSPDDDADVEALAARLDAAPEVDSALRYLYALALEAEGAPLSPAARLIARAGDRLLGAELDGRAPQLRAEAAMPLPVLGGRRLPACRVVTSREAVVAKWADGVSWGVLDRRELARLGVDGKDQDSLAHRLGCFETIPLMSRAAGRGLHLPVEPTSLPSDAWKELLPVWEASFAADASALDGVGFAETLRSAPWFPVGGESVAPVHVWRIAESDRFRYSPLPLVPSKESRLLDACGIARLPAAEDAFDGSLDAKATAAIQRLASHERSLERPRAARLAFARLARGLAATGAPLPVLVAAGTAQPPTWLPLGHSEPAYLPSRETRGQVRFFPGVPQVCAEGGADRAARWGARPFAPTIEFLSESDPPVVDGQVKSRLRDAVPWLLALADGLRVGAHRTPEEVGERWSTASVARGANVFLRLTLHGAVAVHVGWRDEATGRAILNDAFLRDDRTAWCDVPDPTADARLWLHRFAPWFASAIFGSLALETPFRSLLERLGEDWDEGGSERASRHLEIHDIDCERVADLGVAFAAACWTPAEQGERRRIRREVLSAYGTLLEGADLLAPWLGPDVWGPEGRTSATEAEVHAALSCADPNHPVGFACRRIHQLLWQKHQKTSRSEVLVPHILHEGIGTWSDDSVARLHDDWAAWVPDTLDRIDFDPRAASRARFPGRAPTDPDELRCAEAILQRRPFATLEAVSADLKAVAPRPAGAAPAVADETRRVHDQGKASRGRSAEEARAEEAARRVARAGKAACRRIAAERARLREGMASPPPKCLAPVPWLETGEAPGLAALARSLHVALEVDCGYDVLDVEAELLLRVEVKSHAGSIHGDIQVFLTANELRRALETRDERGVSYRLEVYLGYGRRIDATAALHSALGEPWLSRVLTESVGVAPQTFMLTLSVPPR